MDAELTFKAGEAGQITGVSPLMQRDWRRRGLVPAVEGDRARFPLGEVSRFCLIRALADLGLNLTDGAALASQATAILAEATFARIRKLPYPRGYFAAVAMNGDRKKISVCRDCTLSDLQPFSSLLVINLDQLADEMAYKIDLVAVDRRIEALDEEMATRGL